MNGSDGDRDPIVRCAIDATADVVLNVHVFIIIVSFVQARSGQVLQTVGPDPEYSHKHMHACTTQATHIPLSKATIKSNERNLTQL